MSLELLGVIIAMKVGVLRGGWSFHSSSHHHHHHPLIFIYRIVDGINMSLVIIVVQVDCGIPSEPMNGFLGNYTHTREGAVVTYGCVDGYQPSATNTATCMESGEWYPPPDEHNCTLVTGMLLANVVINNLCDHYDVPQLM